MTFALTLALALVASQDPTQSRAHLLTEEAERAATAAVQLSSSDPRGALERARRALDSTSEFEPTAFVRAGRKGEVVEDAFQEARLGYARHRAVLYEAVGTILARQGQYLPASRYLRRA